MKKLILASVNVWSLNVVSHHTQVKIECVNEGFSDRTDISRKLIYLYNEYNRPVFVQFPKELFSEDHTVIIQVVLSKMDYLINQVLEGGK